MNSPTDQQHERIRLGLLEYTVQHAVEDDYATVAARDPQQTTRRVGPAAAAVLAAFGLTVAVAITQTTRSAASDEADRRELIGQIKQAQQQLKDRRARITTLTDSNQLLQEKFLAGSDTDSRARKRLRTLSMLSGATSVKGKGIRMTIADGKSMPEADGQVVDKDLQRIVNGLWQAGAEAIAINGQRLTPTTAIRHAGSAITVNYTSLSEPYVISAIGDPDTLPSRFARTTSGATWLAVQKHFDMQFELRTVESLTLPAATLAPLRSAHPRKDKSS
ncbi:MAG TPA: DUF881 domain-containing protein [Marmoricola sp.]|nr:DUF881 domain-containing protein [Marmoricola sp.]